MLKPASREAALAMNDLKSTFRQLLKSPGFTVVSVPAPAVLALALASGHDGEQNEPRMNPQSYENQ